MRLAYTMRDDADAVLEARTDTEPLVSTEGEHQVIVGLERVVQWGSGRKTG